MEDLIEPQNCQNWRQWHAQEWVLACVYIYSSIQGKKNTIIDSLLSNTIYFDTQIQLLVTNGELLLEL